MANEMQWSTQSGYLSNLELNLQFQKAAQPLNRFRQFVTTKEAFGKHKGASVNWLKVANVGDYGGAIAETNTMHETTQALTLGTLSVNEYGNSIPFTFKVESLSKFDVRDIVRGGLLDDAVKCIDGLVEREFNSSVLRWAGNSTTTGTATTNGTAAVVNTSALNSYHIRKMALELKKRNVPGYSKLGGDYAMICSLEAYESLIGAVESVNQYTTQGYEKILNGEQGRWHGIRIVEDGFASRFSYDSAARTATAFANFSTTSDMSGNAYLFGSPTIREAIVVPEEIRAKLVTDYGRSHGIAWYALLGYKIEWGDTAATQADCRIIKWDSKTS